MRRRVLRWLPLALLAGAGALSAAAEESGKPAPPPAPAAPSPPGNPAPVPAPDALAAERVRAHVAHLASADFAGRAAPEDRKRAGDWIAERFAEAGVKPVPGQEGWFLPFEGVGYAGRNVAGWIAGETEEVVVASAHFDGPGTRGGVLRPGADDDASGVAALVEAARALAAGPKPRRSVLVVAFDLGEHRCRGSAAFAETPPVPIERLAAFTTADLLGRSLGDVKPGLLMVMGEERSDGLEEAVSGVAAPEGVLVRRLGLDFHALGASDATAFAQRRVPSLLLSSGASRDHGGPGDAAERVDASMLAARGTYWLRTVRALADAPKRPTWKDEVEPRLREMEDLLDLVRLGVERPDALRIPETARPLGKTFLATLSGLVARKAVKPRERDSVRFMALAMFGYLADPGEGR